MNLEMRHKRIPFIKYYPMSILIILLAGALVYGLARYIHLFNGKSDNGFTITESGANIKTIVLPDKTIVHLNRNSKLTYRNSFNKTHRELILEGEAYFEVEYKSELPFLVFADRSSVMVRGTKFNIKEDRECIAVIVISGFVEFYETENTGNRLVLDAGESGIFDKKTNQIHTI
jgi:transmembrane sensor